MTSSLKYIAYTSLQSHRMTDADMRTLLKTARKKNENLSVTGMLVHVGGSFVQFLEGPENNVDQVYGFISKDPRHHNVLLIAEGEAKQRHFKSWNMAFNAIDAQSVTAAVGYRTFESDLLFTYPTDQHEEKLPALILLQDYIRNINN